MKSLYSSVPSQTDQPLPQPPSLLDSAPEQYEAGNELAAAVNVAIHLGQPLLVTGEPGTGKTELAHSVAWQLRLGPALTFETKSTSTSRDLLYTYDFVGRMQDSDGRKLKRYYINYNALGRAILLANEKEKVAEWLPDHFQHDGPKRSVVLIDEIDKAPRDFPNDLLNELGGMFFRVPELGLAPVRAPRNMRPVVIITSNSEKHLPDAFLRRCVYFHIEFPEKRLAGIVARRIREMADPDAATWLNEAIDLFKDLRQDSVGLQKKPATAELIMWIAALREAGASSSKSLREETKALADTLGVLIKLSPDLPKAHSVIEKWQKKP